MRHSDPAHLSEPGRTRDVAARPRPLRLMLAVLLVAPVMMALALLQAVPAVAETRIALVIGINAYQNAPALANPVNDARAIGDALRRLNFEVEELTDPDYRALTRGVRNFGIRAQTADTALVYYAGHGVQVDRENYLIPADAKLERPRDLAYEALPVSLMLDEVSQASKIGIVLLDSCRNNPFIERVARAMSIVGRAVSTTQGMARVDNVPRNTMVVMAAKADQIAEDGRDHSPFAAAVLAHLQIPGLELSLFVRSVRDAVLRATANRQEPYVFSSLGAEPFYFYPRPANRPPVIGPIPVLQVMDTAGPTRLGFPTPSDPDLDPLSVRIIGLPRGGEVRVVGRKVALGEGFSIDQFMTGTFKPDGSLTGAVGTVDILVEDGRGGSVVGTLPIMVVPPAQTKVALAAPPAPAPSPPLSLLALGTANGRLSQDEGSRAPPPQASPAPLLSAPLPAAPSGPASPPAMAQPPAAQSGKPDPAVGAVTPGAAASNSAAMLLAGSSFPGTSALRPPVDQGPLLPPSTGAVTSLADARALAVGVPCALLDVREAQGGTQPNRLLVTGLTLPGAAFDTFVRQIGARTRSVGVATEPLDPGHCAAVGVMADVVRHTRERSALRLATPPTPVTVGGPIAIAAERIPNGALYIDLYASDGSVQHLRRGLVPGGPADADVSIVATAAGPPGQHLLVAIATAAPLDSEQRPASESEAAYLPVLRHELARLNSASVRVRAEIVPLSVIAVTRPVALSSRPVVAPAPPPRAPTAINARCQDIVSRVILGEALSESDRTLLRTSCGK